MRFRLCVFTVALFLSGNHLLYAMEGQQGFAGQFKTDAAEGGAVAQLLPPVPVEAAGVAGASLATTPEEKKSDMQNGGSANLSVDTGIKSEDKKSDKAQTITQQPEAKKEEAKTAEEKNQEPEGLDTLDIQGGGNWLLKRGWWEQAERRYEKIKALLDQVMDSRMSFFAKRSEVDRNILDPFYSQMGLDQGRLEEVLSYLVDELNQERAKEITLSDEERSLLATLSAQKQALESLKNDVQSISKYDHAIDDALGKLMEQMNVCRNYEKQAWQNFKDIARELSDEKAKELYYSIETLYANMNDVYIYIQNAYSQYFNQVVETASKKVDEVRSAMLAMKEKGIDLKKQGQRIMQKEAALEHEQERAEQQKELEKAKKKAVEEAESAGIFGSVWRGISGALASVWHAITGAIGSVYDAIKGLFGIKSSKPVEQTHAQPTQEPMALASAAAATPGNAATPPAPTHDVSKEQTMPTQVIKTP
jgi:hypothetical protein